jgi:hypothetical protein
VRRKAGIGIPVQIYVLADEQLLRPVYDGSTSSIFISRQALDWLSRGEIDALVASQLRGDAFRRQATGWFIFGLVVYVCAAIAVIDVLKIGFSGQVRILPLVAAVEILALTILWHHLRPQVLRRAIEIAGNPEAYLSAMVKLSRLSGSPPDERTLSLITNGAGTPRERLQALLEEPLRPAEDRYPTSGDYMKVGFYDPL